MERSLFPSPSLSPPLCWPPIHHDITVMENIHTQTRTHSVDEVETGYWTEIPKKAGWSSMLKSVWYYIPPVGDLEVKRVMSLRSVEQQPVVSACMDKSRLWSPEDWNKSARNYLVDKGRSKGKTSTDLNLQHLYVRDFCHARLEAEGLQCQWVDWSV